MLSLFMIALILNSTASLPTTEDTTYDCAVAYAREFLQLNADFLKVVHEKLKYGELESNEDELEHGVKGWTRAKCPQRIEQFNENQIKMIRDQYEADHFYDGHGSCIVEKLKEYGIENLYLLKYVYENDKNMTELRRNKAVWEVFPYIEFKMTMAEEVCQEEKEFSDWFDILYAEHSNDSIEDLEEAFCWKSLLNTENYSGITAYGIDPNPENIDVTNINCTVKVFETEITLLTALKSQFVYGFKSSTAKQAACYHRTIKADEYAKMHYKVWLLGEKSMQITIREDKKSVERGIFVEFMKKLYAKLFECAKKVNKD